MADYIFDLDGTVADNRHRLHLIKGGRSDWDEYNSLLHLDGAIEPMARLWRELVAGGSRVAVLTGRMQGGTAEATLRWLGRHALRAARVGFRADGDFRPADAVKEEGLAQLRAMGFEPALAFDDNDGCAAMFRRNGVWCAHMDQEWLPSSRPAG